MNCQSTECRKEQNPKRTAEIFDKISKGYEKAKENLPKPEQEILESRNK